MAVTFYECRMACASNRGLVENYNGLRNSAAGTEFLRLLSTRSTVQVDMKRLSSGALKTSRGGIVHFAHDIWKRMPLEARQ